MSNSSHVQTFIDNRLGFHHLLLRELQSIGRLPNELLSYIFLLIVDDPAENHLCALTISHVCLQWRQVALSNGALWARIVLTFPISDRKLSRANTWLSRSSTSPLDILLDVRDPEWGWKEDDHNFRLEHMQSIMQLLITHVERWQIVEMRADTWAPICTFLWHSRKAKAAPMLEKLSLSRCNAYFTSRDQTFQPASLRRPIKLFGDIALRLGRLREVSLVGVHIDWSDPPLKNLTHLVFQYHAHDVMPTLEQFQRILLACPTLLHLSIIGWGPILNGSSEQEPTILGLPILTRFSFGFMDTEYATRLLSLLDFPCLTQFKLEDISKLVDPLDPLDISPLLEWFSTTHQIAVFSTRLPLNRIRIMEFHGVDTNRKTFSDFLQQLTSLHRLGCYNIDDDIVRALVSSEESIDCPPTRQLLEKNWVCPLLAELHCQDVDPETILDIISSRASTNFVFDLRKVILEFRRSSAPSPGSTIHTRLVNAGVIITSTSSPQSD
jgi:F-box-like